MTVLRHGRAMNFTAPRPPIERAVDLLAALSLSGAAGFALVMLLPLHGFALGGVAVMGGVAVVVAALVGLGRIESGHGPERERFEPIEFIITAQSTDELLLDDPITPLAADSRVVQLFKPEPLPDPGELAARISNFLDQGREAAPPTDPVRPDASAALHAALADIRRSLR
ncbi:MAG: hypothetical protein LH465_07670 [Sphingomonas bacterium]|nr:hypothetical protein [Sphingomonas bacterium]